MAFFYMEVESGIDQKSAWIPVNSTVLILTTLPDPGL